MNSEKSDTILITGGLGFVGSHVVVQLLEKLYNVIILDNLSNARLDVLDRIKHISTPSNNQLIYIQGDIRDLKILENIFISYKITAVMHFAALKSVKESEIYPDLYYDVNVNGTKNVLKIMQKYNCNKFIYSSSATVYGSAKSPVTELMPTGENLTCNYARNKNDIEQYLIDNSKINKPFQDWTIIILRYFNPIGGHPSGLLGDDPNGIPNNVFPYLLRVVKRNNTSHNDSSFDVNPYNGFTIFGNDYNTIDGTCVRDYIHVEDLARAHVTVYDKKITQMPTSSLPSSFVPILKAESNIFIYNVGTGKGTSVLELINTLNEILKLKKLIQINYSFGNRREGDNDISYADVSKIKQDIGFATEYDVYKMCEDGLKFINL